MTVTAAFLALICVTVAPLLAGVSQVRCSNQTIRAKTGDDVHLVYPLDPEVDASDFTMDVMRSDITAANRYVFSIRRGKINFQPPMDQYRDRTALNSEDLKRGVLNVLLRSVSPADSGEYTPSFSKFIYNCAATIIVEERTEGTTAGPPEQGTTAGPPVENVTKPGNPGAPKEADGKLLAIVLGSVFGVLGVAALVAGLFCLQSRRRRAARSRGAEGPPGNSSEMKNLNSQTEEALSAAERGDLGG